MNENSQLSHSTIEHIIEQKEEFIKYANERDAIIWKDSDFRPGPLLDRIADRITLQIIREQVNLLDQACDEFIDCLVQSEFFPETP